MPLTEVQKGRIRAALAQAGPRLRDGAPVERAQQLRQVLERAGANPTWAEWAACAWELLDAEAPDGAPAPPGIDPPQGAGGPYH